MGGSDGADIGTGVEGECSGNESVAICGNSLSGNRVRDSFTRCEDLGREEDGGPRTSSLCSFGSEI